MDAKDRAFLDLYTLGKRLGRNLPMEFLERYKLANFAQATVEQMREFYTGTMEGTEK